MRLQISYLFWVAALLAALRSHPTCEMALEAIRTHLHLELECPPDALLRAEDFTAVFRIVDPKNGTPYAAKVIHDFKKMKVIHKELMKNEAEVLQNVKDHTNVIRLIGTAVTPDFWVHLMEFAERGSLHSLWEAQCPLLQQPYYLLKVIEGIVNGLLEIHRLGYAMVDLKLENIVVMSDFSVKLIDFGMALKIGTSSKYRMGTPIYMDPRLFSASKPRLYDDKVDVYSLGILTYLLINHPNILRFTLSRKEFVRETGIVGFQSFWIPEGTEATAAWVIDHCRQECPTNRPTLAQVQKKIDRALREDELMFVGEDQKLFGSPEKWDSSQMREKKMSLVQSRRAFEREMKRLNEVELEKSAESKLVRASDPNFKEFPEEKKEWSLKKKLTGFLMEVAGKIVFDNLIQTPFRWLAQSHPGDDPVSDISEEGSKSAPPQKGWSNATKGIFSAFVFFMIVSAASLGIYAAIHCRFNGVPESSLGLENRARANRGRLYPEDLEPGSVSWKPKFGSFYK